MDKRNSLMRKRISADYSQVLTNIFEFMLVCGYKKASVLALTRRALGKANAANRRASRNLSGGLDAAALVLDAWHRNRRYLNRRAKPRAVRLLGPAPSVEALIRAEPSQQNAVALARRLKSRRFVVPSGKGLYKPAGNIALLSEFDSLALQHVARSLSMLIETVRRNLTWPSSSRRLIERIAEVPDLPLEYVHAFQRFTQTQGWILLKTVNDWLESRRARMESNGGKTVRAGIHVHSYVGEEFRRSVARKPNPNPTH
jgi:hypothetical protein